MELDLKPPAKVGTGNALFLADLAMGVSDTEMRERFRQGRYEGMGIRFIEGWRAARGRK